MSGTQAKAARRLQEAITQVHDRLHKDDVAAAHELCHQALGTGQVVSNVAPLANHAAFDSQFRELATRYGVRAAYVLGVPTTVPGRMRLVGGGDAELDAIVANGVRAAREAEPA